MQRAEVVAKAMGLAVYAALGFASTAVHAQNNLTTQGGAALFEARCSGCHSLGANRVGPMLRGVVDRRIGSAPDYNYSDAVKHLKGKWDANRLDKWLQGPQAVAPGTNMTFSLSSPEERKAVIEFLKSTSAPDATSKK
jgi:cytochrome c